MAQFVKNLPAMQETPVQFRWNTCFPRQIKVICTSQCGLLESKQVQANKSTVVVADPLLLLEQSSSHCSLLKQQSEKRGAGE